MRLLIKSCTSEENFKSLLHNSIVTNKVSESTNIANDSWAWNATLKAIHINKASTSIKGSVEIHLGYLKLGDKLTISTEFMNIAGTRGKIALESGTNPAITTSYESEVLLTSEQGENFRNSEIEYNITKDAYYKIIFGLFTADIGEFYIRNCVINIHSIYKEVENNFRQTIKAFTIRTTGIGVFERDARFGVDECTINKLTNWLEIVYSKPFTYNNARPIVIVGAEHSAKDYLITCESNTILSTVIKFYNKTTGTLIPTNDVPENLYFDIISVGYDWA